MALRDSYTYRTELEWTGRRAGVFHGEELPLLPVTAPPEFAGDSGVWTPEHLLLASSASCFMTTYLAIAEIARLTLQSFRIHATAKLEKVHGEGYRFTEIRLSPEIVVAELDLEKAQRIVEKAEKSCFVTKSLKTAVVVEPRLLAVAAELAS